MTHENESTPDQSRGKPSITVIGESLIDIIEAPRRIGSTRETHPGGSPLNVAVGCSRLDLPTTLVTGFAEDHHGQIIAEHLDTNGVTVVVGGRSQPTSTAVALLDADGAAQYSFSLSWDIEEVLIPAMAAVESATHVHTGSIAALLPPGNASLRTLIAAAQPHATTSFDPNCRPAISADVAVARRWAEDFVAASDIVKASDEDLCWLYPDRPVDESMAVWLGFGPSLIVMTRGAKGPVLLTKSHRVEIPGETIEVADTVGAGDSFMAGIISGLAQLDALGYAGRTRLHGLTPEQLHSLVDYANRAAAITCSRPGANPPSSAELGALTNLRATESPKS